jgi:hypothetical protein
MTPFLQLAELLEVLLLQLELFSLHFRLQFFVLLLSILGICPAPRHVILILSQSFSGICALLREDHGLQSLSHFTLGCGCPKHSREISCLLSYERKCLRLLHGLQLQRRVFELLKSFYFISQLFS